MTTTQQQTDTWCTPPMGIANEAACLLAPMHAGLCEPPLPMHPNAEGADVELEPAPRRVWSSPSYYPQANEDDEPENPHQHTNWDMAFGANLTFSATADPERFDICLNISDAVKADGIMVRSATREQVAEFAKNLLRLQGDTAS